MQIMWRGGFDNGGGLRIVRFGLLVGGPRNLD
jgi:hypothetical protein